jgi:hypothetical protein
MILFLIYIWTICTIFNCIFTFFEFRKRYNIIYMNDIIMFLFIGILVSPILTFINLSEMSEKLRNIGFKNPFYKGQR